MLLLLLPSLLLVPEVLLKAVQFGDRLQEEVQLLLLLRLLLYFLLAAAVAAGRAVGPLRWMLLLLLLVDGHGVQHPADLKGKHSSAFHILRVGKSFIKAHSLQTKRRSYLLHLQIEKGQFNICVCEQGGEEGACPIEAPRPSQSL